LKKGGSCGKGGEKEVKPIREEESALVVFKKLFREWRKKKEEKVITKTSKEIPGWGEGDLGRRLRAVRSD